MRIQNNNHILVKLISDKRNFININIKTKLTNKESLSSKKVKLKPYADAEALWMPEENLAHFITWKRNWNSNTEKICYKFRDNDVQAIAISTVITNLENATDMQGS